MPTAPGFASVSVQMVLIGMTRPAYITFGVDPTSTDPQQVAISVNLALIASGSLVSGLDSSVSIPEIRVSLGTDGGEDLVGVAGFATIGGTSQGTLPPNCATLVHKITARGGRRGRGRLFIPWILGETNVDEAGIIDTARMTTLQSQMTSFLAALTTQQVPMVLLHDPGKTAPGAPNPVTALQVDKLVSTQRRRLGR